MMLIKMIKMGAGMMLGALMTIGIYELATPEAKIVLEAQGTVIEMGSIETPDAAHPAGGSYEIVVTEGGMRAIKLSSDFHIVHAPDPHVRVNGKVIAKVVNYEGAQSYPIPNFIGDVESVNIWCEIADISLGNGVKQ